MTRLELLHDNPEGGPFLRLPFTAVFLLPEALDPVLLLFGSQLKLSELFLVLGLGRTCVLCTSSGDGDLETAGAGSSAGCSLSLASDSLSVACNDKQ